jgi:hypothetical protein
MPVSSRVFVVRFESGATVFLVWELKLNGLCQLHYKIDGGRSVRYVSKSSGLLRLKVS